MVMTFDVILEIDKNINVLAQAAPLLQELGLFYQKHNAIPDELTGSHQLMLEVKGEQLVRETVWARLAALRGVYKVIDIIELNQTEKALVDLNLDDEGRALADKIAVLWPQQLMKLTQNYEDSFHRSEQEIKVTALGEGVGRRLAVKHDRIHEVTRIPEALKEIVIPLLNTVARPQIKGNDLEIFVSLFSRRHCNSMDLVFGTESVPCYFLIGFIQGVINQASQLPRVKVTEPLCRANGERTCYFKITPIYNSI